MPTASKGKASKATSARKASTKKTTKKVEEKVNMGKLQREICKDILDTAAVTKSQVSSSIIEKFSDMDRKELKEAIATISAVVDQQSSSLIDRVIKTLK